MRKPEHCIECGRFISREPLFSAPLCDPCLNRLADEYRREEEAAGRIPKEASDA